MNLLPDYERAAKGSEIPGKKRKNVTKEQAEEMLALLANEFGIIKPNLLWSARVRRGRTFGWGQNLIRSGPKCWRGAETSLLHEFTHILVWRRAGSHRTIPGHTEFFWRILEKVCIAWHGTADVYPWRTEYVRGQVWAEKKKKVARS